MRSGEGGGTSKEHNSVDGMEGSKIHEYRAYPIISHIGAAQLQAPGAYIRIKNIQFQENMP